MVHGIIITHGGDISVYSERGQGTTFCVYLPCLVEIGATPAAARAKIPRGTERVLLVDDEREIAIMTKEMLERLGYRVTARVSSPEALELFRDHPGDYDVVVTDQTMPELTGDRLAAKIRALRPEIPIVMITGFSKRITEDNYRRYGIREFVMKPLLARDLKSRLAPRPRAPERTRGLNSAHVRLSYRNETMQKPAG